MNVLITGNSGGLGLGFTEVLLERNAIIWGMSRRGCPLADDGQDGLRDRQQDLGNLSELEEGLERLLSDCQRLDLDTLNAGKLRRPQEIPTTVVQELEHLMA